MRLRGRTVEPQRSLGEPAAEWLNRAVGRRARNGAAAKVSAAWAGAVARSRPLQHCNIRPDLTGVTVSPVDGR
jgi:hypothetical protein